MVDGLIAPGKLADGTDDPNDWIDPASDDGLPDDWIASAAQAGPSAGTTPSGWPSAGGSASLAPPAPDPFTAYWSKFLASQVGALAWAPPIFPNAPGFNFGTPNTPWSPTPQPDIPRGGILESLRDLGTRPGQVPYAGILESLRGLGTQPGQVPYAGILEGLRYLGAGPDQTAALSNGGIWDRQPGYGLLEKPADSWRQPFFARQASTSTATAAPDGRKPIADYSAGEIAGDAAKSFGVGTGRGVLGLLGLGGDVREAWAGGVQKAADYLAPGFAPNIGAQTSEFLSTNPLVRAWNPLFAGPTSSQLQNAVEQITGPFYQPKTVAGDYGQTFGQFLPGALLVPGGGGLAARALRYGLVPALSSETAGQLTQGTAAEPWARLAGAILGGGLSAWRRLPLSQDPAGIADTVEAGSLPAPTSIEPVGGERPTYLYQKVGPNGEHLKFGVTASPTTRYTKSQLAGGRLKIIAQGSRGDMLELERNLHEALPIGPEEGQQFYIRKQVGKGLKAPPY